MQREWNTWGIDSVTGMPIGDGENAQWGRLGLLKKLPRSSGAMMIPRQEVLRRFPSS